MNKIFDLDNALDVSQPHTKIRDLHDFLSNAIVEQDQAVDAVVDAYEVALSGFGEPDKPLSSLLCLGPTGTGKTTLPETMAQFLHGEKKALIRINCAEFHSDHTVARLIGSPPGYLGHDVKGLLSQEVIDQYVTASCPYTFLLFDEIEKAHPKVFEMLLSVLDKGDLRMSNNTITNFNKTFLFLSSNLGARGIVEAIKNGGMGFARPHIDVANEITQESIAAATKYFTPEFLARLSGILPFKPLSEAGIERVFDLQQIELQRRIVAKKGFIGSFYIKIDIDAKGQLLEMAVNKSENARNIKKVLFREVGHMLGRLSINNKVIGGDVVTVIYDKDSKKFEFYVTEQGVSQTQIHEDAKNGVIYVD